MDNLRTSGSFAEPDYREWNPLRLHPSLAANLIESTRINQTKLELTKAIKLILGMFTSKKGKALKKEYIRVFIIRAHKKLMRNLLKNPTKAVKGLLRNYHDNANVCRHLETLLKHFLDNKMILDANSHTEAGPLTEGKAKKRSREKHHQKSHNDHFVREYFSDIVVRESYHYFVNYVFADSNETSLCSRLKFFCCREETHCGACSERWLILKFFFQELMLHDVNLREFQPLREMDDLLDAGSNSLDTIDDYLDLASI